jgi:tetratricopeptide (TPR) repeat protein
MKWISLTVVLFLGVFASAQEPDSLFIKANKFYQNEQYTQALQLYKDIEEKNIVSEELYYNMANAYFKTNQVAHSIYYYEKALQLDPNDEDILFNLDYANRMIIDNIEPLPKSLGQKFRENVILRFTYNTWAILAVVFALLFALLFLLYHFSNYTSKKRLFFITSIISASLVLIMVFFAHQNKSIIDSTAYAIVFAQKADVKSAPTISSEINFELHEGTKVRVVESLDNWRKIKLADGNTGWISAEDIKEL